MKNHQNANPFMPNMLPLINSPAFMNTANNFVPFQNNQFGVPHMGLAGHPTQQNQFHMGFGPQNSVGNMNYNPMFPVQGQMMQNAAQVNLSQPQGQILAQNILNMLQQHNLNMPNGQFPVPGPLQNMNQQLPMQVPNPSHVVPFGMPPGSQPMVRFPNQVPGAMVPHNPIFSENPGLPIVPGNQVRPQVNQNKNNMVPPTLETNTSMSSPFVSQQLQGNSSSPLNSNSNQPHHRKHSQSFAFTKSQANPNNNYKAGAPNSNWKGSPRKNFKNKPNRGGFQGGFQKSKFHNRNNGKRKFGFPEDRKGKGCVNSEEQYKQPKSSQTGKSLSVTYTEQEIQQWREARRKRYPTKDNIEKKQGKCQKDSKVINREVLRNELKEILAKQAELGVEVAEIPSYYLADLQKKFQEKDEKRIFANNKRKNQNKIKGRPNRNDRFAKKQKLSDREFSNSPSLKKKTPTLLQKLLSADIERDKSHLLQVFRFMAMNSFFKDYPDKPLTYPSVIVKEAGLEGAEGKSVHTERDVAECCNETTVQEVGNCHNDDAEDEDSDNKEEIEGSDEEEGEIID